MVRQSMIYPRPYHPTEGIGEYRRYSEMRKPRPGMILEAARKHKIDLEASVLIGDNQSDMEASINSNIGLSLQLVQDACDDNLHSPWIMVGSLKQALEHLNINE